MPIVMVAFAVLADTPEDVRARLERARRTRHQARLIADGQIVASGPWRSDHLAAVVDRNRIREYQQHHQVVGQAEISTMVMGVAS